ncbi:GGDEF domain-containing protein [Shewanella sp. SNU WT4]|uniref:GGDEF domain-containing protein n=1 Tax=Shewanella sp. SNU WT4 TaxID=2590015 RepID=UPI00112D6882|nr:GGDEF domain-containing protein [Shewanella sp. SNU WT4]QDF67754.1 GGDEF domain-containing protein [Shewanella sp. SNU WT4]
MSSFAQIAHINPANSNLGFWPGFNPKSSLSSQDQIAILQRLHASLEPEQVLATFSQVIGNFLPVHGLKLHTATNKWVWGHQSGQHIHRPIVANVTLQYYLAKALSSDDLLCLQLFESWLAPAINNALTHSQVANQAMHDSLTGLGNRRGFELSMDKAIARSRRNGLPLSLMILDLDNFKQVNDNQGHQQGDALLQSFASILNQQLRDTDRGFRVGGDEFTILLDTNAAGAHLLANRILAQVSANEACQQAKIGVSIGLAQWQASATAAKLYETADKALYAAKASGKHTACSACD